MFRDTQYRRRLNNTKQTLGSAYSTTCLVLITFYLSLYLIFNHAIIRGVGRPVGGKMTFTICVNIRRFLYLFERHDITLDKPDVLYRVILVVSWCLYPVVSFQ